jgi:microcystin-dependent protein
MASPYLSQIMMFGGNFAPRGYALCNGQTMAISQNAALFSLLGTTYGGNGTSTFQLPNLQGRAPIHFGTSTAGIGYVLGQTGGEESHTLSLNELPNHTHMLNANKSAGNAVLGSGNLPAAPAEKAYNATPTVSLSSASIASLGGNQPHSNQQPFLVVTFCIALQGVFPSRN